MTCPFPGMDPYLEKPPYWGDFTPRFITSLAHELLTQLLPRYEVCVEEYLYLAHEEIRLHRVRPDVAITSQRTTPRAPSSGAALLDFAIEELEYPAFEPSTQRHLKVIQPRTGRVVTVIEVLSPANKQAGEDGLDAYLEKRAEYLVARVNLVEIDLLRGGERLPMAGELPPGDYYVYVGRAQRKPRCQVIGWPWRRTIPPLPVPLLPEDGEAMVDLEEVFRAAYDLGYYERRLPYQDPLAPPLNEEDAAWAKERLVTAGRLGA